MITPIPIYLQPFAENVQFIDGVESQFQLQSSAGNKQFEIWYHGDLLMIEGEEMPLLQAQPLKSLPKIL